jgi:hypothetical protein
MFVCFVWVVCCQVEVFATSWSLVQRSSTDCGASLCVITKPREGGGRSPSWAAEPEKIIIIIIIPLGLTTYFHLVSVITWSGFGRSLNFDWYVNMTQKTLVFFSYFLESRDENLREEGQGLHFVNLDPSLHKIHFCGWSFDRK